MFQRKKIIRLVVFLFVILALLFLILIRIQFLAHRTERPHRFSSCRRFLRRIQQMAGGIPDAGL